MADKLKDYRRVPIEVLFKLISNGHFPKLKKLNDSKNYNHGWFAYFKEFPFVEYRLYDSSDILAEGRFSVYDKDIAKDLWGVEPEYIGERYFENGGISDTLRLPKYLYHLQCMVIAKDPIAYLGDNI